MTTDRTNGAIGGARAGDAVWRVPQGGAPVQRPAIEPPAPLDLVAQLDELQRAGPTLESNGLADALLDWLTPRPSNPETLAQGRIAPLLGAAADLLARHAATVPDIAGVGARALEQELREQRALAHRRSTLLSGQAE